MYTRFASNSIKDGLELLTNLPPLSECWDHRQKPSRLVFSVSEIYPRPCACYLSTTELHPQRGPEK